MIAAILKLSRDGHRSFNPEPLNMSALLQMLADAQRHQCEAAGAAIVVDPNIPSVVADRLAVEQIFGNLIDNGIKYLDASRPGRVAISGRSEGGGFVRFDINDNGRGIDAKDHARVFDLFRRSGTLDRPGEGIGLAHVRTLVRALGGHVEMASQLGRGTKFSVVLPANIKSRRSQAPPIATAAG